MGAEKFCKFLQRKGKSIRNMRLLRQLIGTKMVIKWNLSVSLYWGIVCAESVSAPAIVALPSCLLLTVAMTAFFLGSFTGKMTLLSQQNVLLIYPQQTKIVELTILLVTVTIVIVVVTIHIVVTSGIVTTKILVCWGYINKTFCWGNKVFFSVFFLSTTARCFTVQNVAAVFLGILWPDILHLRARGATD